MTVPLIKGRGVHVQAIERQVTVSREDAAIIIEERLGALDKPKSMGMLGTRTMVLTREEAATLGSRLLALSQEDDA